MSLSPPYHLCAQERWWRSSCSGFIVFLGGHSSGGETCECLALVLSIPMKIVLFSYDTGIAATLSLRNDDCRRPTKGRPRSGSVSRIEKTPNPLCLAEAMRRESIIWRRFSGCELIDPYLFLQSRIFQSFENYPAWINCRSKKKWGKLPMESV